MQTALQPPGIHSLSDSVIGFVSQRSWFPHHELVGGQIDAYNDQPRPDQNLPLRSCADTAVVVIPSSEAALNCSKRSLAGSSTHRPTTRTSNAKHYKLSGRRGRKEKESDSSTAERRREYHRTKQQRYRERQRGYEEELVGATGQLNEETVKLRRRRDQLTCQAPRHLTVWIVATEYLRIVDHGIFTTISSADLDFLHASTAPDVLIDTGSGVDAL
ncbi:hypothetical protein L915_06889, partial [Phytophthora nicotianae]